MKEASSNQQQPCQHYPNLRNRLALEEILLEINSSTLKLVLKKSFQARKGKIFLRLSGLKAETSWVHYHRLTTRLPTIISI